MLRFCNWGFRAALIALVAAGSAHAAISGLERVASSLAAPIFVTHAPGDRSRLFIAERGGAIRILNLETGAVEATPFLTMSGISTDGEGGFLGLAFHPNYFKEGMPGYGKFYVNVTTNNTTVTHIREFTVSAGNPNFADNETLREILSFSQPQTNHNGGWIDFSPANGLLYIPTGDGGNGDDFGPGHTPDTGNAQDITDNLLGKILRIDVNGDDFAGDANRNYAIPAGNPYKDTVNGLGEPVVVLGDDEIWARGMRNPFRDSFDRLTGDLWLGDVGQGTREEIDRQPVDAAGGENFGWKLCEGSLACAQPANYRAPVYDYGRPVNPASDPSNQYRGTVVSGGYVYRGPDPSLQGKYFFLDSRNSAGATDDNYWNFDISNPTGTVNNIDSLLTPNIGNPLFPVSFGEDANGNLYIAYIASGEVYRIATNELIAGDYNADGEVDDADYAVWQTDFGSTEKLDADGNGDLIVDAADYTVWRDHFGDTVHNLGAGSDGLSVPEPSALGLVCQIGLLLLIRLRSRGRL